MDSPLNDGLLGEGVDLIGSELTLEELVLAARERYKWMPFCVVEEWVILDAILTEDELAKVAAAGFSPCSCLPTRSYMTNSNALRRAIGCGRLSLEPSMRATSSRPGTLSTYSRGQANGSRLRCKASSQFSRSLGPARDDSTVSEIKICFVLTMLTWPASLACLATG